LSTGGDIFYFHLIAWKYYCISCSSSHLSFGALVWPGAGGARLLVPGAVRAPGPAGAQAATALQQILRYLVSTPCVGVGIFICPRLTHLSFVRFWLFYFIFKSP